MTGRWRAGQAAPVDAGACWDHSKGDGGNAGRWHRPGHSSSVGPDEAEILFLGKSP